jgi:uncharacterized protein involved in exopolysaccharide biosynthesis
MTHTATSPNSGAFPVPASPLQSAPPPPAAAEGTIFSALSGLLRNRALVLGGAMVLGLAGGVWALSRERVYTSVSSFMPEGRQSAASGLAAQLGLALPGAAGTESPQFYVDLLRSRELLGSAVVTVYTVPGPPPRSTTLIDVYEVEEATPALRRDAAIDRLNDALDLSPSPRTNVVSVKVSASSAVLAQQVNKRLLDLLGEFNQRRRQSRASEERRFAEERLTDVKAQLRVAEDRLQTFLQSNRDYENSPSLVFSYERLQADVQLLRQVVMTLQQSAEQAKIEEVRDTPTITLVESASLPVRPDSRGIVKFALIGAVLGTFLGIGIAFVRETFSRSGVRASSDYEEFVRLRREALSDLLHPWRALRRRRRAGTSGSSV